MKVYRSVEEYEVGNNTVATLGTFDGMHLGHRFVIQQILLKAKEIQGESLIISLHPHPRFVLGSNNELKLIHTLEEKIAAIEAQGVDKLLLFPFDQNTAQMSSEDFIYHILFGKLQISYFLIGYDHHFGKNRTGNFQLLHKISTELHKNVEILPEYQANQKKISSTIIRNAILQGNIEQANEMLGEPFQLSGIVVQGDQRGRLLGYPTANVQISDYQKIIPISGVYVAEAILNSQVFCAVVNIGIRPTFQSQKLQIEAHILDFSEEIYGKKLTLKFLKFLRKETKFQKIEDLVAQIQKDILNAKQFFSHKAV